MKLFLHSAVQKYEFHIFLFSSSSFILNPSTCTIFAEAGSDGMLHCEVTLSACIANGKQAQTVWADSFASFSRVGASVKISLFSSSLMH